MKESMRRRGCFHAGWWETGNGEGGLFPFSFLSLVTLKENVFPARNKVKEGGDAPLAVGKTVWHGTELLDW